MGILNYTTSIPAANTANEMQKALGKHGAESVSIVYQGGHPSAISFTIGTEFGPRHFQLPANVAGVEVTIRRQQATGEIDRRQRFQGVEHARRVAWRILKDWLLAQLAIIEAGMTSLDEVMLPYMLTDTGLTVTQAYRVSAQARAAIEAGGDREPIEA